ncbi:MAG: exo-alpha-sialidase [Pseudonocardiaceae bacterium]|nr:exo-alpha-sialidase [Pseudonocardiaceae bacterium]
MPSLADARSDVRPAAPPSGELLADQVGMYPRLIRLEHGEGKGRILATNISVNARGVGIAPIFESTDEGESFQRVGTVADPEARTGMCCGTLFELPQQVGELAPGTLLWSASIGQDGGEQRRKRLPVWYSTDVGRSWSKLSECTRAPNTRGQWEPEFSVAANGELACHYADETVSGHDQALSMRTSPDGVNWSDKKVTMALTPWEVRPGMPIVRRLPDGRYFKSHEVCNYPQSVCGQFFRISDDGINWGDPAQPGDRVFGPERKYFRHASTITTLPGGPNGVRIASVGEIYANLDGTPAPKNGQTLLINDNFGAGEWYEWPAPVKVPNPENEACANYSSVLLPVDNGQSILEIAAGFDEDGTCKSYFAKAPAPQ